MTEFLHRHRKSQNLPPPVALLLLCHDVMRTAPPPSAPHTDLSRMVGYRPCQLQQPRAVVVLLLATFCCWYWWTEVLLAEAEGTSFLVGNSSAAIIFQSGCRPGHGRSGTGRKCGCRASSVSDQQRSLRSTAIRFTSRSDTGKPNFVSYLLLSGSCEANIAKLAAHDKVFFTVFCWLDVTPIKPHKPAIA